MKVLLDICQGKARSEQSGRYFVQARPHLTSDYRHSSTYYKWELCHREIIKHFCSRQTIR